MATTTLIQVQNTPGVAIVRPPTATAQDRAAMLADINKGYRQAGITLFGFSTQDIFAFFGGGHGGITLAQAESIQRAALGIKQTRYTAEAGFLLDKATLKTQIEPGIQHLSEHIKGSHYHGDFGAILGDIGRGFTAMFTLGLSEIPVGGDRLGKILRVEPFVSSNLSGGIFTTGSENKLEKTIFGDVFKAGTAVAGVSALSAGTSYSVSGALNPAAASTDLGSSVIGQATGQGGGGILSTIGSGVTQAGKFIGEAIGTAYIGKLIAGGKAAINDLLHGNIDKATKDLLGGANPLAGGQPGTVAPSALTGGGGYGGGGGGYGGNYGVQQSSMLSTVLPFGILAVVILLFVFLYKRK